jgi:ABC-type transporter Mla MlaB component
MTDNNITNKKKARPSTRKKISLKPRKKAVSKQPGKPISDQSEPTCTLKSISVINDLVQLKDELQSLLADNSKIYIDASNVEMIDTATLQLLLSFQMDADAGNGRINWVKPSEKFIYSAELLGLKQALSLP